eukprot:CAMPEP_0118912522 /NCGR_PEP_ID=MMETSP1166-20130328/13725_1 /TAXON_ID=1104430 /ORGANISM="Chrysoreinhardia sp, Strain CCMP3193" /LENGTH=957 /DNA_ID=CAMNT_0006852041 /DNA_START=17 /DNA_END=2887 /DNA_ORIENTATION=+
MRLLPVIFSCCCVAEVVWAKPLNHTSVESRLARDREERLRLEKAPKGHVIVARKARDDLFESMAAVVSGYAVALVTGRGLIVDAPRLRPFFDLGAYEVSRKSPRASLLQKQVDRCRDSEKEPCLRRLKEPMTWVATCHEKFVGDFLEDPRMAYAQLEARALVRARGSESHESQESPESPGGGGRRRCEVGRVEGKTVTLLLEEGAGVSATTTMPLGTDEEALAAYDALSECRSRIEGDDYDSSLGSSFFVALATARASFRQGWSSSTSRSPLWPHGLCPAWDEDPVDVELTRSLREERRVFGTLKTPEGKETPPPTDLDVARLYLRSVLWRRKDTILIYENRIYADRYLLENDKARKHINFLASMSRHRALPNVAYIMHLGSTGQGHGGFFGTPTNHNSTTWENVWKTLGVGNPQRRQRRKRRKLLILDQEELTDEEHLMIRVPSLSIAKMEGYEQPSILIPNMYFGNSDLDTWSKEIKLFQQVAETRNFDDRRPAVFWRGGIRRNDGDSCDEDVGNYARLAAASLSLADPMVFDIKCVDSDHKSSSSSICHKLHKARLPCEKERDYDARMRSAVAYPEAIIGEYVHREDFSKFQFLLNLPGSLRGSYSRNLNHLWALDSVVLLWNESGANDKVVEWYYPALKDNVTHVDIDKDSAVAKVREIRRDPRHLKSLRAEARKIHERYLAPEALTRYFLRAFQLLRGTFDLAPILDYPATFEAELDAAVTCSKLSVLEFVDVMGTSEGKQWDRDHPKQQQQQQHGRRLVTRLRGVRRSCEDIVHPKAAPPFGGGGGGSPTIEQLLDDVERVEVVDTGGSDVSFKEVALVVDPEVLGLGRVVDPLQEPRQGEHVAGHQHARVRSVGVRSVVVASWRSSWSSSSGIKNDHGGDAAVEDAQVRRDGHAGVVVDVDPGGLEARGLVHQLVPGRRELCAVAAGSRVELHESHARRRTHLLQLTHRP